MYVMPRIEVGSGICQASAYPLCNLAQLVSGPPFVVVVLYFAVLVVLRAQVGLEIKTRAPRYKA